MFAVAGGIILAIFILLVLSGLWLVVRDVVRFAGRNVKSLAPAAALIPGAITFAMAATVAGMVGYAALLKSEPKFVPKPVPYLSSYSSPAVR